jgi:uncharacterized protein (TIGR00369 family)
VDAERLIAQGKLIEAGRNQATSEALIHDANGRLLAHSTTRCFLQHLEPDSLPSTAPAQAKAYETPDPFERPIPDALVLSADLSDLTGLEMTNEVAKGALPSPFGKLTGLEFTYDEAMQEIAAEMPASPWFSSPAGTIYGGMLATFADGLNTAAATTTLEAGTATATLDMKAHFLRPGIADGSKFTGRSQVLHSGRGLIVSRSELCLANGKPLVLATGSFMRRGVRDWGPVVPR